jgi:hypothetical protein
VAATDLLERGLHDVGGGAVVAIQCGRTDQSHHEDLGAGRDLVELLGEEARVVRVLGCQ